MSEELPIVEIDPESSSYDYLLDKIGYSIKTPDFTLLVYRGAYSDNAYIGHYEEGTAEEFFPIVVLSVLEATDIAEEAEETYAMTEEGIWLTFHPKPPREPRILNTDYHLTMTQPDAMLNVARFVASSLERLDISVERD